MEEWNNNLMYHLDQTGTQETRDMIKSNVALEPCLKLQSF